MHASFRYIIQLLYISAYHWMRNQPDFPYSRLQVWSQLSHWLPDVIWIRHMSKRKRRYRSLMMEEELSGFQVDPAVSDGTPELGRRSGKEFDQQVERKDLYSDWWWYCAQSGWTLCNPVECSPLGSSVYGIFHARVLKWVAISYSRESCWSRDQIWVSCVSLPVCQWEVPTGDIQLWPGGNLRVSHLWTQGPRPKCLPFVKEEFCRKSGFPHWFSLLLMARRFGVFLFLFLFEKNH